MPASLINVAPVREAMRHPHRRCDVKTMAAEQVFEAKANK